MSQNREDEYCEEDSCVAVLQLLRGDVNLVVHQDHDSGGLHVVLRVSSTDG